MTGAATIVCLVLALVLALASAVRALRSQPSSRRDMVAAGVVEVAVLVYLVLRTVDLLDGHHTSGLVVVIAYLVGMALVMPIAAALSWAEPTKWGSIILGSGALVTCVMFARINQLWNPHG